MSPTYVISSSTYLACFFIFITIVIVIVIVHPLFKRNIYLSLYVIGLLFLKINFLSFLPSMQLKHVTSIIAADLVHFYSHVQASHVMFVYLCIADSIIIFLLCVFYLF
jgi:hypothetical protein